MHHRFDGLYKLATAIAFRFRMISKRISRSVSPLRAAVPRFRLRTLLAVIALIAAPFAWLSNELRVRRAERTLCERLDFWAGVAEFEPPLPEGALSRHAPWYELIGHRLTILHGELSAHVPWLDEDDLDALHGATSLRELHLGLVEGVGNKGLSYVERLPAVEEFQVSSALITDDGLYYLRDWRRLRSLDLAGTSIRGPGLEHIAQLTSIQHLDLTGAPLTDEGIVHLRHLSSLECLELSRTLVTDKGLKHLSSLKNLSMLSLDGTAVSGPGLRHLLDVAKLSFLRLDETAVDDSSMRDVQRMTSLVSLDLPGTRVTSTGIGCLRELRGLKLLDLSRTTVDDRCLDVLADMENLESVGLQDTDVSQRAVERLRQTRPKLRVHFTRNSGRN